MDNLLDNSANYNNSPDDQPTDNTRAGALDAPLAFSWFASLNADPEPRVVALRELAERLPGIQASEKDRLPLTNLCAFGDKRTVKNSLRHNANVTGIYGVSCDYDAGKLPMADGAALLEKANIAALLHTTSSHTEAQPRWRIFCPCSKLLDKSVHGQNVARINGALGGVLAPESFVLSQFYRVGQVDGKPRVEITLVEGRFIDEADDLDAGAIGKTGARAKQNQTGNGAGADGAANDRDERGEPASGVFGGDLNRLARVLGGIPVVEQDDYQPWSKVGMASHFESGGSAEGRALFTEWSRRSPKFDEAAIATMWNSFGREREGPSITGAYLLSLLPEDHPERDRRRLRAIPTVEERPTTRVFDEPLLVGNKIYRAGVWRFTISKGGKPLEHWLAGPTHVEAIARNEYGHDFGRVVRFLNLDTKSRIWCLPAEMFAGDGVDLLRELHTQGLNIDPEGDRDLIKYLRRRIPKRRMLCVNRVGWSGQNFVLPSIAIGPDAGDVIFQSATSTTKEYIVNGTLEGWQKGIAAKAIGNPLLVLAISTAFAGPLLTPLKEEGGGVHFHGPSSIGKTALGGAAASVWGGPNFVKNWRATANGIEGTATLHNDCILILDEISQGDPREVSRVIYMVTNGTGKQRAGRTGLAREVATWRLVALSTGEFTLETAAAAAGLQTTAGQEVRLLNICVDRAFGAWDDLRGLADGAAFTDCLKRAAAAHYGHAGRQFLERLTRDTRDFESMRKTIAASEGLSAPGLSGQELRAAARFTLIAMAGELANEYGITGWSVGAATEAAVTAFRLWREGRSGPGQSEPRRIVQAVIDFIDKHGDSRFSLLGGGALDKIPPVIRDRAGWLQAEDQEKRLRREYWFSRGGLREATNGYDFKSALDALQAAGMIEGPDARGERRRKRRIDQETHDVYVIIPAPRRFGDGSAGSGGTPNETGPISDPPGMNASGSDGSGPSQETDTRVADPADPAGQEQPDQEKPFEIKAVPSDPDDPAGSFETAREIIRKGGALGDEF